MAIMTERDMNYIKTTSEIIMQVVQEGNAFWQKPWKATTAKMPHNPISGALFKGFNAALLLTVQEQMGTQDSRWITLFQANKDGYNVKDVDKATTIMFYKKDSIDKYGKIIPPEKRDSIDEAGRVTSIKYYNIFHATQIKNFPTTAVEPIKDMMAQYEKAHEFITNTGATIQHGLVKQCAYYPDNDVIRMIPPNNFKSLGDYYSTAIHELARWTGHESRLDRPTTTSFGGTDHAREELRAEIASYFMSRDLKIDFNPRDTERHIPTWCAILEHKPDELVRACSDAARIVDFCNGLQKEQHRDMHQNHETALQVER